MFKTIKEANAVEERTVVLKIRGTDRLLVWSKARLQVFALDRTRVLELLKDNFPGGYRVGATIKGVRKKDVNANDMETVAEIELPERLTEENQEQFLSKMQDFVKKADQMEFAIIFYPVVNVTAIHIIVD